MLSFSKGLELAMIGVGGFGGVMQGGCIRIFSGQRPINANQAIPPSTSAVLIGSVTTEGLTFYPGNNVNNAGLNFRIDESNLLSNFGQWVFTAVASGEPAWFRWVWSGADDGGLSVYYPRLDGDIGKISNVESYSEGLYSGYDMVFRDAPVIAGERIVLSRMQMWMNYA